MSDRYQDFTRSGLGRLLVTQLGLPDPVPLERYTAGAPLVDGIVAVGGSGRLAESLPGLLGRLGITHVVPGGADARPFKGLLYDATGHHDQRGPGRPPRLLPAPAAQPHPVRAARGARHAARS